MEPNIPRQLRFDQTHQTIEDGGQRRALRDHFENLRLPVAQFVRQHARGDVARDAHQTEDFAIVVAQRRFRRRQPFAFARLGDDGLLDVDRRTPARQDFHLTRAENARGLRRVNVEIRTADQIAGRSETTVRRQRFVDDDKATFSVLDPEIVGHLVDHELQRHSLVGEGALAVPFGARPRDRP